MSKQVVQDNSRALDQFYTNPIFAQKFISSIKKVVKLHDYDYILEPSAGSGSFYNLLDENKRIGLDLEPKAEGIIQTDFFLWENPKGKIITIGNPPFGKNSSLAVKFFNKAAEFSDVIAFVIPKTFRKGSLINRLNQNFHLIHDEDVPKDSFIFNGAPYDVPCCAQIWIKKNKKRAKIVSYKMSQISEYFEIVEPNTADFAIQRVGGRAGLIRTEDYKTFSPLSHYFIKANKAQVLDIFQNINFDEVKFNTAGNPSVSPSELIELFLKAAKQKGLQIQLG